VGASVAAIPVSAGSGGETAGVTSKLDDDAARGSKRLSKRWSDAGMALIVRLILRCLRVEKNGVSKVIDAGIQSCICISRD
jgi:hypothetical protein